jgi:hypothetical protein
VFPGGNQLANVLNNALFGFKGIASRLTVPRRYKEAKNHENIKAFPQLYIVDALIYLVEALK